MFSLIFRFAVLHVCANGIISVGKTRYCQLLLEAAVNEGHALLGSTKALMLLSLAGNSSNGKLCIDLYQQLKAARGQGESQN